MLAWIWANMATLLISLVLLAIVAAVITVMVRDRKKGKSPCGGNCGHCPMGGSCHKH